MRKRKVVKIPLSKTTARELKKLERKTGLSKEDILRRAIITIDRQLSIINPKTARHI